MALSGSCPLPSSKKLYLIASHRPQAFIIAIILQLGTVDKNTVPCIHPLAALWCRGPAFGTQGMLGSGVLRHHVLASCSLLRTYACRNNVAKLIRCPITAPTRKSLASLSWQVQHAKQGTALPGLGPVLHLQNARSRGIFTSSISCSAAPPKTVRDIVRELKKGEPRHHDLEKALCVCPFTH